MSLSASGHLPAPPASQVATRLAAVRLPSRLRRRKREHRRRRTASTDGAAPGAHGARAISSRRCHRAAAGGTSAAGDAQHGRAAVPPRRGSQVATTRLRCSRWRRSKGKPNCARRCRIGRCTVRRDQRRRRRPCVRGRTTVCACRPQARSLHRRAAAPQIERQRSLSASCSAISRRRRWLGTSLPPPGHPARR